MKALHVFAGIAVVTLLFVSSASASTNAFQKFAVWYPPFTDCIGCGNQLEIDLNVTSAYQEFATGIPANISAAGGVYDHTLGPSIKNVTIVFMGASPYQSQPANGVEVGGPPAIGGDVLYPTTGYCTTHANGVIFSQPYLCDYGGNRIIWKNAGTYYPIMTIYLNNGSAPLMESLTTDTVTVVTAPPNVIITDTFGQTQASTSPNTIAGNPYVQDIDAIFGSLLAPVVIVIIIIAAIFRKRLIKEVKDTFHLS